MSAISRWIKEQDESDYGVEDAPGAEDDGADAAPNYDEAGDAMPGSDSVVGELDDDFDDEIFGDVAKKNAEAGASVEEGTSMINNKRDYAAAVDMLFENLSEISVLSSVGVEDVLTEGFVGAVTGLSEAVNSGEIPVIWESMGADAQFELASKISTFRDAREQLLASPTKKNATIVENYLVFTADLLEMTAEYLFDGQQ